MAQSEVDACNSALQKCGQPTILALDSSTEAGRQCLVAFESNRKSELRKFWWNFAIKRAQLAADVDAPAFGFKYQYPLPADCLRIRLPVDASNDWVLEGRQILTNTGGALNLRYLADVPDVTQWDPVFYDLFAISLAIDLAEKLTNSPGKKQSLEKDYEDALAEAKRTNSFEQIPVDGPDDPWWLARNAGSNVVWAGTTGQGA